MRIGHLATKAGVNIQTIRFYERKGLLESPPRSASGYRCYSEADMETLCFIRRSQELGFPLHEISQLHPLHRSVARLASSKGRMPREMRGMAAVARIRLDQVELKLSLLKAMRTQLQTFITQLETVAPIKCLAPATQPSSNKSSSCPA
jgi:DNA-binding transcriptional MerR regulator